MMQHELDDGTTELVRYDAMRQAIAEAHAVDEVKDIRDKARAIEAYVRQARDTELERKVIDIRLRAERRCGELLGEMEMAKGGGDQRSDHCSTEPRGGPQTLAEFGISHDQSSQWQKLAAVPADEFETDLADPAWRPSTTGIIDRHTARERGPLPETEKLDHQALWLWGRLTDFEDDGILGRARWSAFTEATRSRMRSRSASATALRRRHSKRAGAAAARTRDPEWEQLRRAVRTAMIERGTDFEALAQQLGVAVTTLQHSVGRRPPPSAAMRTRLTDWLASVPEVAAPAVLFRGCSAERKANADRSPTERRGNGFRRLSPRLSRTRLWRPPWPWTAPASWISRQRRPVSGRSGRQAATLRASVAPGRPWCPLHLYRHTAGKMLKGKGPLVRHR